MYVGAMMLSWFDFGLFAVCWIGFRSLLFGWLGWRLCGLIGTSFAWC